MTAPGPPALISVISLQARKESVCAFKRLPAGEVNTHPRPKPVQEMVVVEAKPIKLHTVKCRLSSCSWPLSFPVNTHTSLSQHRVSGDLHLLQPQLVCILRLDRQCLGGSGRLEFRRILGVGHGGSIGYDIERHGADVRAKATKQPRARNCAFEERRSTSKSPGIKATGETRAGVTVMTVGGCPTYPRPEARDRKTGCLVSSHHSRHRAIFPLPLRLRQSSALR